LCWLVVLRVWRLLDVLFVGTLCAFLIVIRAYCVIYAALALGGMLYRLATQTPKLSRWRWLGWGATAALPLIGALVQLAFVNRWMTGSPFRSTYGFGFGAFASLDWTHPELLAVLAHPWHGLLVYHPLYLSSSVS